MIIQKKSKISENPRYLSPNISYRKSRPLYEKLRPLFTRCITLIFYRLNYCPNFQRFPNGVQKILLAAEMLIVRMWLNRNSKGVVFFFRGKVTHSTHSLVLEISGIFFFPIRKKKYRPEIQKIQKLWQKFQKSCY